MPNKIYLTSDQSDVLRQMVEYIKLSTKKIEITGNPYQTSDILFNLVHHILPRHFAFDYTSSRQDKPFELDVKNYLVSEGLLEVNIDQNLIWVFPKNYNKEKGYVLSSLSLNEAEGFIYHGGKELLDLVINFLKMDIFDMDVFYKKET